MNIATDMLTLKDAASRLGVKPDHITRLVERGELEGFDIAIGRRKRCLRIPVKSITSFLESRRVGHPIDAPKQATHRSTLPPGLGRICG